MPYIDKEDRQYFDAEIKMLASTLAYHGGPGDFNYVVSSLLARTLSSFDDGVDYDTLNQYIAAAQGAIDEFKRRVLAPYEDTKIEVNGDVYTELLAKLEL